MSDRRLHLSLAAAMLASVPLLGWAGNNEYDGRIIGLEDLANRIGAENVPTGSTIRVGQVEVPDGGGDYAPPPGNSEFVGKIFHFESGPSSTSIHARNVGRNFYGLTLSVAPGIPEIYCYEWQNWWGSGYLQSPASPSTVEPIAAPGGLRVINHSWLASISPASRVDDILRRADFLAVRDNVLNIAGVGNVGLPVLPLMTHHFNGLTVGLMSGSHVSHLTVNPYDGPGRIKPEIVAPGNATSYATPVVGAVCALLIETAAASPLLAGNVNADRSEVIKSVILSGAVKQGGWTNNPQTSGPTRGLSSSPLDLTFGAGLVNVDRGHLILTGGEQDSETAPPAAPTISDVGWDLTSIPWSGSSFYRFQTTDFTDDLSIIATWHRQTNANFTSSYLANINLTLWRVDETGGLVTLLGDDGLPYFDGGNIVSKTGDENVEHLYVTGLQAGEYVLEVQRADAIPELPSTDVAVSWIIPNAFIGSNCPWDISANGTVGPEDLATLLDSWGPNVGHPADFNNDGDVGPSDLAALLSNWGKCP